MSALLRFAVLIPLIFSLVAFVLTNLALFAGHQKGFMEEYAVIRLNTSMLGQDMFQSDDSSDSSSSDDDDGDSLWDKITDKVDDIKDDVKGKISDIIGDIADDLADELGINDWYSLHIMNACMGSFGPNATTSHYKLNTTNCTSSSPANRFNLTEILDHQLSIGPLDLNLADIHWPGGIQSSIDTLNAALLALFVFYVLGVGFSGLAMLACVPAFLLQDKRLVLMVNSALALLAAATITLGSIIATAASAVAVSAINDKGEPVTLVATQGSKFYGLTWAAAALMIVSALFWVGKFAWLWKREKRERERYSKERF
ncbi:actin cortical patch SUR7/pH-response regulator pali [Trichoderma longibrachiatum]